MKLVICILYFAMLVYVINISSKSLHMLQQNLYNENNRYLKWIFKNIKYKIESDKSNFCEVKYMKEKILALMEKLEQIKLDAIPKKFLNSTQNKAIDRPLTEMEKAIILESVNNALAKPLELTQSQYTEAPAE